ncbi:MAG: Holliday junction resolvase RuvX [Ruminococcaceae bacterium]|nr:Holliday junction resolvase RuvX [Oscillospiraceae bacterium]
MVILSVDYGDARTGIAVCDKTETLASPVTVIKEKNQDKLLEKIIEIVSEKNAGKIVVGLPKNMDGSEGFRAEACREFAQKLGQAASVPAELYDERLTTAAAYSMLNEGNVFGKKRKDAVDALAAVIILEDYLKSKN